MKTAEIKGLLKKDLLIVEAKDEKIAWAIIFQKYGVKAVSDYTLLGKPDEIKEKDVKYLVHSDLNEMTDEFFCRDYKSDWANNFDLLYALESFNSAIESEIFWENPLGTPENNTFTEGGHEMWAYSDEHLKNWQEAQEKTFDRKRTLIFVKN